MATKESQGDSSRIDTITGYPHINCRLQSKSACHRIAISNERAVPEEEEQRTEIHSGR